MLYAEHLDIPYKIEINRTFIEHKKYLSIKKKLFFMNKYINKLKNISNNSERVSDKLPINFKWIGFIKLLLPKSRIVHCIRNPKDNCLSIFKTYFATKKLNYAYDLDE